MSVHRKVGDLPGGSDGIRRAVFQDGFMARRSYGTGSLFVHRDARGRETWYGRWYAGGRRVHRKIGPKRQRGTREGLTRAQAERELQRRVELERPVLRSRLTIEGAGRLYLEHLEHVLERKPTTLSDYRSMLRRHIESFFGTRAIERIGPDDLRSYLAAKKRDGLSTKTISNQLVFLHGLFSHAVKRGWAPTNPVASVDRPRASSGDPDIRYLDLSELEALLRAVPDDYLGPTEHALYLTAMTGLRQGELVALRWLDVDWQAARIRVRRNYTRQQFGSPSRSVRLAPCRSLTASPVSWSGTSSARRSRLTRTWCSDIRKLVIRWMRRRSGSASPSPSIGRACVRCDSTTYATPSGRTARRQECL
jgi:integrase